MNQEPSLLDYFHYLLRVWKMRLMLRPPEEIPPFGFDQLEEEKTPLAAAAASTPQQRPAFSLTLRLPWRPLTALLLALAAQTNLEPPRSDPILATALYLAAFFFLGWALWQREWTLPALPTQEIHSDSGAMHQRQAILGAIFGVGAFLLFGGGKFNPLNLTFWLASLALTVYGLWQGEVDIRAWALRLRAFFTRPKWTLRLSRWQLLLLLTAVLALFFRLYRLADIPAEPISDHYQKLLDVNDILNGTYPIFFERNTGREFIQMYWTALLIRLFDTGVTFFSLKLGTALFGLFTLPYMYLLGKETGNRRVAFFALLFTALAYWPNVIARVGLRFPLYPLFTAPVIYHLLRGLRLQNRNDFILAGLFLGLGLNGYSPYRIVPALVLVTFGLFLLHQRSGLLRRQAIIYLALTAFFAFLPFLPLLRYTQERPQAFFLRSLTRMGEAERAYPGSPLEIFVQNNIAAAKMFNLNNNNVWLNSVIERPALDIVGGALFLFGLGLVAARYLRQRDWRDLFLLLSLPILMLPSTLSLAFPVENPSINRAGGAYVIVFLLISLALDGLLQGLSAKGWRKTALAVFLGLAAWSAAQNYDLVFRQYANQVRVINWNYSDLARVIDSFTAAGNPLGNARIVAYPYWVDTRVVPVLLKNPNPEIDLTIWPEQIADTLAYPGNKIFLINQGDENALRMLQTVYPQGQLSLFVEPENNKNFWVFSTANSR